MKKLENFKKMETLSAKELNKISGGIHKVTSEKWTDGVNTYEDSTWSDGSEVCGQFLGCDCSR